MFRLFLVLSAVLILSPLASAKAVHRFYPDYKIPKARPLAAARLRSVPLKPAKSSYVSNPRPQKLAVARLQPRGISPGPPVHGRGLIRRFLGIRYN